MEVLDLFCGAGGAAMGYYQAGFNPTGVDINPQPNYPFRFFQEGALAHCLEHYMDYDLIHASPPCQTWIHNAKNKPQDWLTPTRVLLKKLGKPYIIENISTAPMKFPLRLCGEMFGLRVIRHRKFESNLLLFAPPHKKHRGKTHKLARDGFEGCYYFDVTGHGRSYMDNKRNWGKAMGINWMTFNEMREAIPPAYTKYLGLQARRFLCSSVNAATKE